MTKLVGHARGVSLAVQPYHPQQGCRICMGATYYIRLDCSPLSPVDALLPDQKSDQGYARSSAFTLLCQAHFAPVLPETSENLPLTYPE